MQEISDVFIKQANLFTAIKGAVSSLKPRNIVDKVIASKLKNSGLDAAQPGVNMFRDATKKLDDVTGSMWDKVKGAVTGMSTTDRKLFEVGRQAKKEVRYQIKRMHNDPSSIIEIGKDLLAGGHGNRMAAEAIPRMQAGGASIFGKNRKEVNRLLKDTYSPKLQTELRAIAQKDTDKAVKAVGYTAAGATGIGGYQVYKTSKAKDDRMAQLKQYYMQQNSTYRQ